MIEEFAEGSGLFGSSTAEIRLKVSSLDTIRAPSSSIHIKQRVEALKAKNIKKSLRLGTVYSVKSLVEQQSNGPAIVHPAGAVLIQGGVVPQHGQEVEHDKRESRQGDEIRCHAHWEAVDDKFGVERLEDIFRHERPIHGRVLVLFQGREVVLPHVDHRVLLISRRAC